MGGRVGKKSAANPLNNTHSFQVVMLGLDGSGKTSILENLTDKRQEDSSEPTLGFKVDVAKLGRKHPLIVWEVGGKPLIRRSWQTYLTRKEALVFVVDSSDAERIDEAKRELRTILSKGECYGLPFLLLANKQDKEEVESVDGLVEKLEVSTLADDRQWIARATTLTEKETIKSAFKDLYKLIKDRRKLLEQ